jgi:hypothetical protein
MRTSDEMASSQANGRNVSVGRLLGQSRRHCRERQGLRDANAVNCLNVSAAKPRPTEAQHFGHRRHSTEARRHRHVQLRLAAHDNLRPLVAFAPDAVKRLYRWIETGAPNRMDE